VHAGEGNSGGKGLEENINGRGRLRDGETQGGGGKQNKEGGGGVLSQSEGRTLSRERRLQKARALLDQNYKRIRGGKKGEAL